MQHFTIITIVMNTATEIIQTITTMKTTKQQQQPLETSKETYKITNTI